MAAGDLTTLAAVRTYLGVTGEKDDAWLTTAISRESAFVQSWCNRTFAGQSYSGVLVNGTGTPLLLLPQTPITAVASVELRVGPGVWSALSLTLVSIDSSAIALVRVDDGVWPRGLANVRVGYTAGFATVPADVEGAVCKLVAYRYKQRSRIGERSKIIEGENVAFQVEAMPPDVQAQLQPYRQVVPL